jgi:16S rRNA (uracil1498-N3)-methyltransferase
VHRLASNDLSDVVILSKEASRHLNVLRPKPGEIVELFDGKGSVRPYKVENAKAPLKAAGETRHVPAPAKRITLFACVTKGSRWDWTIEKCVELGVARIVPVISDRCIVRLKDGEKEAKAERWRRVAEDAARQSDAAWMPEVATPVDFKEALAIADECDCLFAGALVEPPPKPLLSELAERRNEKSFGIFVGPEGDFTPEEMESLLEKAIPVSFGPTILRAETAAIFGVSVLAAAVHQQ